MEFLEAYVVQQTRRSARAFVVLADDGERHYFKTADLANAEFPGAFDEDDDEVAA